MPRQASAHQSTFNYILIKGRGSLKNGRIFLNQELAIMQAVSNPVEGKPYAWLAALASGGKGAYLADSCHPTHYLSLDRLSRCREKRFPSLSKKPLICLFLPCYLHNTTARWSGLFLHIWGKFSYGFFARSYSVSLKGRGWGANFFCKGYIVNILDCMLYLVAT